MSDYTVKTRGTLPDNIIKFLCENHHMITPYIDRKNEDQSPSHGMSSYGYDITLGCTFKTYREPRSMFTSIERLTLQPGKINDEDFNTTKIHNPEDAFILGPGEFCLAESGEVFNMPSNVVGVVKHKSTFARMGIDVFAGTVLEPGWVGILTLEIVNKSSRPVALYPYRGIAQVMFEGCEPCDNPYRKNGKYQNAKGLEIPK